MSVQPDLGTLQVQVLDFQRAVGLGAVAVGDRTDLDCWCQASVQASIREGELNDIRSTVIDLPQGCF